VCYQLAGKGIFMTVQDTERERKVFSEPLQGSDGLRHYLEVVIPSRAQVNLEDSGLWSASLPGVPLWAEAPTYEAVIEAMIGELREYAAEWREELFGAPNHRENWGLVLLVGISRDQHLAEWLGCTL
jgi:hypothetical protein